MTLQPKRPPAHWDRLPRPGRAPNAEAFGYGRLYVLSELGMEVNAPDGSGDRIPTWLVSVSRRGLGGQRPSDEDMARVRCAFDMLDAEEDNHEPGIARKLFMCVNPSRRVACECKTDETVVVEPDGYRWSAGATPDDCGGCDMHKAGGRPCPVHRRANVAP